MRVLMSWPLLSCSANALAVYPLRSLLIHPHLSFADMHCAECSSCAASQVFLSFVACFLMLWCFLCISVVLCSGMVSLLNDFPCFLKNPGQPGLMSSVRSGHCLSLCDAFLHLLPLIVHLLLLVGCVCLAAGCSRALVCCGCCGVGRSCFEGVLCVPPTPVCVCASPRHA